MTLIGFANYLMQNQMFHSRSGWDGKQNEPFKTIYHIQNFDSVGLGVNLKVL
jgi:hypothetical protein